MRNELPVGGVRNRERRASSRAPGARAPVTVPTTTTTKTTGVVRHGARQLEGRVANGPIHALRSKVTLKNGRVEQSNSHDFPIPRLPELPPIAVALVESGARPGELGEVGVPLVAPAVANAVLALTGKRIRSLPLEDGGIRLG